MTLWLVLALMTAAAVLVVLWPLGRSRTEPRSGSELEVYRDQIREIARDRSAGLVGAAEAEAAQVEVSRRLLAAAEAAAKAAGAPMRGSAVGRRVTAFATLLALPAGAAGLYLVLGSPNLPDLPLAARLDAPTAKADVALEKRSLGSLLAQIETHLAGNPEDGRGWEVVGPVYMRLGRFDDALKARRNALRLLGSNAKREADLGETLVAAANGIVTADAKAAFDRAVAIEPRDVRARFFIGLAAEQDGTPAAAAAIWRDLLDQAPANAPWVPLVKQALARAQGRPEVPAPGPTAEDVAQAGELSADQQTQMVRGMVARLAERLKRDGSDVEGWLRLVRAYAVLGEHDKARSAVEDARRALAGDPDKLHRLDDLVKGLGSQAEAGSNR